MTKVAKHVLEDGNSVHSFSTLLSELSTIVRNTCRTPLADADAPTFDVVTTANPLQKRAFELLQKINL